MIGIDCAMLKKQKMKVIIYGGLDTRMCKDLYDWLMYNGIKVSYIVSTAANVKKFQDIIVIQDSDLPKIYNEAYILIFWEKDDYVKVKRSINIAETNYVIMQREIVTLNQLKEYKDLFGNEIIIDGMLDSNNVNVVFHGQNNKIIIDSDSKFNGNMRFELHDNARLEIKKGSRIDTNTKIIIYENSSISIEGANIGEGCEISARYDSEIKIKVKSSIAKNSLIFNKYGGKIEIGESSTFETGNHVISEGGEIYIGDDLMTSYNVDIICGDGHGVFDVNTGLRRNKEKKIVIGDHVWIGTKSTILGGAKLGNDIIVGANSVVNKDFSQFNNVVVAGNVSKVVSRDTHWERYLL